MFYRIILFFNYTDNYFSNTLINKKDGTFLNSGDTIVMIQGNVSSILKKERVVLNLIQRLSGIASILWEDDMKMMRGK